MIKYIRREEEEISLDHYYTEFVAREHFQNTRHRNRMLVDIMTKDLNGLVEKYLKNEKSDKRYIYEDGQCDVSIQIFADSTGPCSDLSHNAINTQDAIPYNAAQSEDNKFSNEHKVLLETDI